MFVKLALMHNCRERLSLLICNCEHFEFLRQWCSVFHKAVFRHTAFVAMFVI